MRYKELGFKWLSKYPTRIKFGVTVQEISSQSPTISCRQTLTYIVNKQRTRYEMSWTDK